MCTGGDRRFAHRAMGGDRRLVCRQCGDRRIQCDDVGCDRRTDDAFELAMGDVGERYVPRPARVLIPTLSVNRRRAFVRVADQRPLSS
jgi:hypothetical protein